MFFGFYGLMGFCWGLAWLRATFFPYILFLFCVPIVSCYLLGAELRVSLADGVSIELSAASGETFSKPNEDKKNNSDDLLYSLRNLVLHWK